MLLKSSLTIAMLGAAMLGAGGSRAQQPNPLDAIPDKMPFDIPYGAPISLERAQASIAAAVAEMKKRDWKMSISIVGPSGDLVALATMDGTQLASVKIGEHKARVAARFRRETKALENGFSLPIFTFS